MGFTESINTCFRKYVDFSGRASRSEFWWFALFRVLVLTVTMWIPFLGFIVILVFLLPSLSGMARRLHDVNRTGWWMLLPTIIAVLGIAAATGSSSVPMVVSAVILSLIAGVVVLVFLIQPSDPGPNRYGLNPLRPQQAMEAIATTNKPSISPPPPAEGDSVSAYVTEPTNSPSDPEPAGRLFCDQCGMQLQPDARFCTACGAAV